MKDRFNWVERKFSGELRLGAATLLLTLSQTGCIAVGYSSRGGWFMWPGGFGLLLIILLLWFLFNRR